MAAEAPPPSSSSSSSAARRRPDWAASLVTYIGSLTSVISTSEMRFEGVLYNIDIENSSFSLVNVWSFGTEGRKKDGMQIPASSTVYKCVLFKISEVKDLQFYSSPPPPQPAPLHNVPTIIQSHYPQPASTSSSLPTGGDAALPDLRSQPAQYGFQRPSFQSNIPLYQPGNTQWGSCSLPPAGYVAGLSVPPMYLQANSSLCLPQHWQQPSLLQPSPGSSAPQTFQYPGPYPSLPSGQGPSSSVTPATTASSASLLGSETSKPLPSMTKTHASSSEATQPSTFIVPKTNSLIMGNLSGSVREDDLRNFFQVPGDIVKISLATFKDGTCRGSAQVEFTTPKAVEEACKLSGRELMGKPVTINFGHERSTISPDNRSFKKPDNFSANTVLIRGFDAAYDGAQVDAIVRKYFFSCGIKETLIVKDGETGASAGSVFMEFDDHSGVVEALSLDRSSLCGFRLHVEEAKPSK